MSGVPYGITLNGAHDSVHSLDKFKFRYILRVPYKSAFNEVKSSLESLSDWRFQPDKLLDGYNGFLDKLPSSSYGWSACGLWVDLCNFHFGLYHRSRDGFSLAGVKIPKWSCSDQVVVEFNPNKCFSRSDINICLTYLKSVSQYVILEEVDYSVDIPCKTSDIFVKSRKNRVSYNDSRYYGKRHQHGRLKVYNKKRELKDKYSISVDGDFTRCEYTARYGKALDFGECSLCLQRNLLLCGLSSNLRSIAKLVRALEAYGEDAEELLSQFVPDCRNRDKLRPFVVGVPSSFVFDVDLFVDLLNQYAACYGFSYCFSDKMTNFLLGDSLLLNNYIRIGDFDA